MDRGFGVAGSLEKNIIRALAPVLESLGFRTLWINDTPDGDSLQGCATACEVTTTLRVATGVIPVDRRSAAEIVADIDRLGIPADRLTIGIGSGMAPKPLGRMRVTVAQLRETADPVAMIAVGALGPQMTALAASLGDEVLLNWLTPEAARISSREVSMAASDAGRSSPRLTAYVRVAMDPTAIQRLATEARRYGSYPSYAAHFRRFGVEAIDTTIGSEDANEVSGRLDGFVGTVDEIVVRAITGSETFDAYRDLAIATASTSAG